MIRVLVVDDSAIVRQVLERELSKQSGIEVVGTASDPYIARDKIIRLKPDVMTLDIEMPRMDGLTFLQKIMKHFPIPTVVVSSLTEKGSAMALEAIQLGAVDVVSKPGAAYSVQDVTDIIASKIRAAALVDMKKYRTQITVSHKKTATLALTKTTNKIVAIGASTGGTVALEEILCKMPAMSPGMVVALHIPPQFSKSLAERLNALCSMSICEAKEGDEVVTGRVLIAPGNHHMELRRSGARYYVHLHDGERRFYQRPAVEVLFDSVALYAGANAVGVMLTGMGKDGAEAMKRMRDSGALNIIQDEKSSVVWGMPGEAFHCGAADHTTPLKDIPSEILRLSGC